MLGDAAGLGVVEGSMTKVRIRVEERILCARIFEFEISPDGDVQTVEEAIEKAIEQAKDEDVPLWLDDDDDWRFNDASFEAEVLS